MLTKKFTSIFTILILISLLSSCIGQNKNIEIKEEQFKQKNTTKHSIAQALQKQEHLPIAERIALYHKLKKEAPETYSFENEDEMTMYGYKHLWNNQLNEALEIFKLIVEEFPNSSNPYDSLGEVFLAIGDSAMSLKNYEISLKLNPDNFNAEDQIERIKHPNKKSIAPEDMFYETYTPQAYIEDLNQLGKKLLEIHPNALKFITETDFWQIIKKKKALINNNTTFAEFAWHCSEIISSINCSHTSMGSFSFENDMLSTALRFPLQTKWLNGRLYVIDPYTNQNKINIKDEVIAINNIPVSQLISNIYKHINTQGYVETTKNQVFNMWSTVIIPYALGFPKNYTVKIKGKHLPVKLNRANNMEVPFVDNSIPYCGNNLCLEIKEKEKIAVMIIYSFNYYPWNNLDEFQKFIDESFKKIKEKQVNDLIIDLRFNGGGSPESSIYLLKHLAKKPFAYFSKTDNSNGYGMQQPFEHRFKGNLFFLIDGHGQSTTGHFMALAKELNLGTIIGEELGSNQFCTAGQTILRLSNTKLVYYVANSTSQLAEVNLPDEQGIIPDYKVTQSIDDYLNKTDTVKEFAFKLIDEQN